MGHGERRGRTRRAPRRRRNLFSKRRNRVGARRYGRRRRGGYSQQGGLGIIIGKLCALCIFACVDLVRGYQRKLDNIKEEQDEILKEKAKRDEQNKMAAEKAEKEAEAESSEKLEEERAKAEKERKEEEEEEAERIKELQEDQMELLNDIMERQAKETDPARLQTLFNQQNDLIAQMNQIQGVGYKYDRDIPAPKEVPEAVPQAAE